MKRYDLSDHCAEQGLLVHAALGDFIRYKDHAAFVERVREIAEGMEHGPGCESLIEEWVDRPGNIGFVFPYKCNCRRGQLLALCEVK